jgi:predicted DNA-binding protein (MmcQ/YjbR family)
MPKERNKADGYREKVEDALVQEWIKESYQLVASKLPKAIRQKYIQMN